MKIPFIPINVIDSASGGHEVESSFRFLQKEGGLPDLDDLWRRGSLHRAREGFKQRFLLTGVASGDNEIKQRRNFSETHFPGVAPCGWKRLFSMRG
jgi:hypothetical protein